MREDGKIVIKNEQGEEKEFSILSTFDIAEKKKSYVIYTDYTKNENGNLKVYASIYNPNQSNSELKEITEDDEIKFVDEYIKKLEKRIKQNEF